jgi:hypothetical protein
MISYLSFLDNRILRYGSRTKIYNKPNIIMTPSLSGKKYSTMTNGMETAMVTKKRTAQTPYAPMIFFNIVICCYIMKIGSRKTIIVPINQNKPISLESILNPKIEIGFILKTFSNTRAINATRR